MAVDSTSYAPLQYVAGDTCLRSKQVTIAASAGAISALAPLKRDASGQCVLATAIADEIVGILVPGIGSEPGALVGIANSGATQAAYVYTQGDFWADQIGWGATLLALVTTDDKKDQVFDQSGINLKFSGTGTGLLP